MYKDMITNNIDNKEKQSPLKIVFLIIKIILFSFLFLSMLWGCSQMFVSKFSSSQIVDSSGTNVYKPGVFFEILFPQFFDPNDKLNGKFHFFHYQNGDLYEYPYFSISSWSQAFTETSSPFYGCFVYPVGWLLVAMISTFSKIINHGSSVIISIFLMSFLTTIVTMAFSWKSQLNQEKMQLLQFKQNEIKAKYKGNKDPVSKRKQQTEIMQLYKKHKINPLASILSMFLAFPFLFALYIAIRSTRVLKTTQVGAIDLIARPWTMVTSGHLIYLVLLLVYLPIQVISMFLPTLLNLKSFKGNSPEQIKARRKQYIIQGVMILVFVFVAVSVASGVVIYWIFRSVLQLFQTLAFHYVKIINKIRKKNSLLKQKKFLDLKAKQMMAINGNVEHKNLIKNKNNKKINKKIFKKEDNFSL